MSKPCVHIELSIGFYGNYKRFKKKITFRKQRFKKKIAKEKSKKSSPKNLVVLVLVLQAFLDTGLPRGNRHERDS